ncbi:hypothetical protein CK203_097714 [Vitis vinifera]|uniref:Uncharacterized protein n=1 Tax=Vitis vinifera TaxID=29760 RepID=A0A438C6T0_VITVI|nr:hypothetical protein CK203_097714 [Vitis vinifera]
MDFIDKGVAWARNICATFEAMCLEVDDIMYKHAEQAMGSQDDMSLPTSDEVAGCKFFRKAVESSNLVNAIAHPSSALLSSSSVTCNESSECKGWDIDLTPGDALYAETVYNPAAYGTVSTLKLSQDGFEAYNKFAESGLSVSLLEIGITNVAELSMTTIRANDKLKLDENYNVVESHERCSASCKAANHRYCKESQVSKTRLARGEDNELQAGDVDAGSNQQKGHDLWESEWVLV